jgi:hypothetical protein
MSTDKESEEPSLVDEHSHYWRLLRDVVVFQGKLALDGLRDVLLSPLSIILAIAGAIFSPADPHRFLRRLMHFGQQSDEFINLFEHPDPVHDSSFNKEHDSASDKAHYELKSEVGTVFKVSSSTYVKQLEDLLVDEYRKGGIVRGVKEGTDEVIRKLLARRQTPRK